MNKIQEQYKEYFGHIETAHNFHNGFCCTATEYLTNKEMTSARCRLAASAAEGAEEKEGTSMAFPQNIEITF